MPPRNELEALIEVARDAGWRVSRQTTGHRVLVAPDGVTAVTAPTAPSDQAGLGELRERLRAAGIDLADRPERPEEPEEPELLELPERPEASPRTIADPAHARRQGRTRDNAKALADAPKLAGSPPAAPRTAAPATQTATPTATRTGNPAPTRGRPVTDEDQGDAEGAVRRYLSYLEDPEGLRDVSAIADAEQALAEALDPIDKLKAMAALRKAEHVDGTTFEAAFTRHAKDWADSEDITVEDFLALGVSPEILAAAGFANAGRAKPTSGRAGTSSRSTTSRSRLNYEAEVLPAVAAMHGDWKLSDLADVLQRDPQATRNALRRLLEDKKVEEIGYDTTRKRRGRTPKLYRSVVT